MSAAGKWGSAEAQLCDALNLAAQCAPVYSQKLSFFVDEALDALQDDANKRVLAAMEATDAVSVVLQAASLIRFLTQEVQRLHSSSPAVRRVVGSLEAESSSSAVRSGSQQRSVSSGTTGRTEVGMAAVLSREQLVGLVGSVSKLLQRVVGTVHALQAATGGNTEDDLRHLAFAAAQRARQSGRSSAAGGAAKFTAANATAVAATAAISAPQMSVLRAVLQCDENARFWNRAFGFRFSVPATEFQQKLSAEVQHVAGEYRDAAVADVVNVILDLNEDRLIDVVELGVVLPARSVVLAVEDRARWEHQCKLEEEKKAAADAASDDYAQNGLQKECVKCKRLGAELDLTRRQLARFRLQGNTSASPVSVLTNSNTAVTAASAQRSSLLAQSNKDKEIAKLRRVIERLEEDNTQLREKVLFLSGVHDSAERAATQRQDTSVQREQQRLNDAFARRTVTSNEQQQPQRTAQPPRNEEVVADNVRSSGNPLRRYFGADLVHSDAALLDASGASSLLLGSLALRQPFSASSLPVDVAVPQLKDFTVSMGWVDDFGSP